MIHIGVEHAPAIAKGFIAAQHHDTQKAQCGYDKGERQIIPFFVSILRQLHSDPPGHNSSSLIVPRFSGWGKG